MKGHIHSIESFGTVDGPGVRFVVFFQGCPMRCLYCHNPDTWDPRAGVLMESGDILRRMLRNREFYVSGGITASGGEPMLQPAFLTELFGGARALGIHTALDTSGITFRADDHADTDRLMDVTDLVLLDFKHMSDGEHRKLTGHGNRGILAFADYLKRLGKPLWARHVVIPGITFREESLTALGRYLKTLPNLERLEVLPYHSMGRVKYESLGMEYPLGDTPQLTKDEAAKAEALIRSAMS